MRELSGGDPWRIRSGITTVSSRRAGTAASSSSLEAQELDEVQYGLGEGSCLTAARDRALVLFPDLRVEPRWPRHAGHMVSRDIGSVLAVPFELQDGDCAALNLSSRDVHEFDPRRVDTAQGYADQASSALALALKVPGHREEATQLLEAMKVRAPMDLAAGVVVGQSRCSPEEAVGILRAASNCRNIKLRDVTAAVVGPRAPIPPRPISPRSHRHRRDDPYGVHPWAAAPARGGAVKDFCPRGAGTALPWPAAMAALVQVPAALS
ncbi:GAF and ANTAR domain-containing protein [Paeniglutamicibacter gangotriensis]|uniref:GAF and ANTAR domain-containing protein n=1 Tax=Paeniglutamicibacter gangotriensis TaxID=254787 RepID=A0A5B0E869_9MICC|nr:GAF and ANTAR domain-containing protein [Paeniglutamicibacter gangotriensis]KAA0975257.1 GAF and ANTAR domain-containing protein [Paeniglutamicibacter gangotriensis]